MSTLRPPEGSRDSDIAPKPSESSRPLDVTKILPKRGKTEAIATGARERIAAIFKRVGGKPQRNSGEAA